MYVRRYEVDASIRGSPVLIVSTALKWDRMTHGMPYSRCPFPFCTPQSHRHDTLDHPPRESIAGSTEHARVASAADVPQSRDNRFHRKECVHVVRGAAVGAPAMPPGPLRNASAGDLHVRAGGRHRLLSGSASTFPPRAQNPKYWERYVRVLNTPL